MKYFNVLPTLEVFTQDKEKKLPLSRYAHHLLLETDYLVTYLKPLRKMFNKSKLTMQEVTLSELIGHYAKQMPAVKNIKGDWFAHQLYELPMHMASLFINVLQDSGELEVVTVVEQVNPVTHGGKSAKRKLVITFNGLKPTKDLSKGLESVPGKFHNSEVDGLSLPAKFKDYAKRSASMAFKRSDVATIELLTHGYTLSKDYNSSNPDGMGEARAAKKERIKGYATKLIDMTDELGTFYLSMKYDTRGRMYTLFNLIGMRPQGKLWETLMIDAATPRVLGGSAIKHLKHIIYCTRYGKVSVARAVSRFTEADLQWAVDQDPMAITRDMKNAEKLFGEAILVNKAAVALKLCIDGKPCGYLFGKDLTNSGLMGFGASFGASKVLSSVNLGGGFDVNDAYTIMHKQFNLSYLSRDEFKDMIMPLFNGARVKGLVQKIIDVMTESGAPDNEIALITEEHINTLLVESLGVEILNIGAMTTWATKAVNSYQTRLLYTSMDGFKACSYAHIEHCPVSVVSCSATLKSRFRVTELVADLPYHCQANGMPIYSKDHTAQGCKHPVKVKNSGGFANSAHTIDPVVARRVGNYVMAKDDVCLLKHDDYITFADNFDDIIDIVQAFYEEVREVNPHKKAIEEMHANGVNMPPLPMLHVGTGTVKKSLNFLMP